MDIETWQRHIQADRAQKNMFFASHPQSPLSPATRGVFSGLAYWPPNSAYCLELALYEHAEETVLDVQDTVGQSRNLLCWGEFRFEVNLESCTLQAYKSNPDEGRLFLPFRDQTSGNESYGASRYTDLQPSKNQTRERLWIVDFNSAYNPWCAYSSAYACPLVSPENWLRAAIRAGEKAFAHPLDISDGEHES